MGFGIALKMLHEAKARLAEQLGFDYLSTGEHISSIATPNNIVALAAAAGRPNASNS